MLPILQAAILGIVQGLTEFLPVSSTAHLLIGSRLLGYQDPGGVFTVMIQLGSILAIMWLYRAKILRWLRACDGGNPGVSPDGSSPFTSAVAGPSWPAT